VVVREIHERAEGAGDRDACRDVSRVEQGMHVLTSHQPQPSSSVTATAVPVGASTATAAPFNTVTPGPRGLKPKDKVRGGRPPVTVAVNGFKQLLKFQSAHGRRREHHRKMTMLPTQVIPALGDIVSTEATANYITTSLCCCCCCKVVYGVENHKGVEEIGHRAARRVAKLMAQRKAIHSVAWERTECRQSGQR